MGVTNPSDKGTSDEFGTLWQVVDDDSEPTGYSWKQVQVPTGASPTLRKWYMYWTRVHKQ